MDKRAFFWAFSSLTAGDRARLMAWLLLMLDKRREKVWRLAFPAPTPGPGPRPISDPSPGPPPPEPYLPPTARPRNSMTSSIGSLIGCCCRRAPSPPLSGKLRGPHPLGCWRQSSYLTWSAGLAGFFSAGNCSLMQT